MRLLARREHTRKELAGKVWGRTGGASQDMDGVLDRLEKEGLLSDRRFAEEFVSWRMGAWGDMRIAHELKRRGVEPELADKTMAKVLGDSEGDRALAVLEKKHPGRIKDRATQAKLRRFLEQRGFGPSSIRRAFESHRD